MEEGEGVDRRMQVKEGFLEGEGWGGVEESFDLAEKNVVLLQMMREHSEVWKRERREC